MGESSAVIHVVVTCLENPLSCSYRPACNFYLVSVLIVATHDRSLKALDLQKVPLEVIAFFGVSGTAGDVILNAALADSDISKIHVITRRAIA